MTTIACTCSEIASDSQASDDTICHVKKLFRVPGGILGFSGVASSGPRLAYWLINERRGDPPDMDGTNAVLITGVDIYLFDESPHPYSLEDKFAALGTGSMAALSAMHCGKTPAEAVKIAAKIDPFTGGKIRTMVI